MRPDKTEGGNMKYEDAKNWINEVMLVDEGGEVVSAGTRDQMYSVWKSGPSDFLDYIPTHRESVRNHGNRQGNDIDLRCIAGVACHR